MNLFRPLGETELDLRNWASEKHTRIPTGFPFIDELCQGGVAEGEVALVMAYSGVGKTALGCNVAVRNRGVPTLFFSLEMQARFILKRLAAIYAGIPDWTIERDLRSGKRVDAIDVLIRDFPRLAIVDKPAMSLKDMGAAVAEAAQYWGERPRLVVVDYMELVGGVPSMEAVSAVDKVSRRSKDFAREHDVALFMLHQLNQGGESYKPVKVKDARYGGNTAADYVIAAYRPCLDPELNQFQHEAKRREFYLQFLKTRGGSRIHPSGMLHDFDPESMRITGVELQQRIPA